LRETVFSGKPVSRPFASLTQDAKTQRKTLGGEMENRLAREVVDAAYVVHCTLGPGLLESVYEVALAHELSKRGHRVERQKPIPVIYDGIVFEEGFRADIVLENAIIIELKSVEKILPVHKKQVLTYLRLTKKKLGLLINFGESLIKDGIHRVVNGL
jgi:GxxExxY protein